MSSAEIVLSHVLSPVVLAFGLGILAVLIKSDLEFPEALYHALSIYLLFAIGLKGGMALRATPLGSFAGPALVTLGLGIVTPLTAFGVLRGIGRIDAVNSAAIAAHYGSVSVVTFLAAQAFAQSMGELVEGHLPALVAILEVPAIVVALLLVPRGADAAAVALRPHHEAHGWSAALREVLAGRSIVLLLGGLVIGAIGSRAGLTTVEPFFVSLFPGVLALFLLELGMVAARRLRDLRRIGGFLLGFGILVPIAHGCLGTWAGHLAGMTVAGSAILGSMVASASYIAAPAAVRIALPQANPTYYLTASLGITFPFNMTLGIPLYFALARWIAG